MGELAGSVLQHGGRVVGIIPEFLVVRERLLRDSQEVVVTRDMHERKRIMFERSDAFVALPGGIGTLEELVEQITWAQLGQHRKPILLANIDGFWGGLLSVFEHMSRNGYIHSASRLNFLVTEDVEQIVPMLTAAAAKLTEEETAGEPEAVRRM